MPKEPASKAAPSRRRNTTTAEESRRALGEVAGDGAAGLPPLHGGDDPRALAASLLFDAVVVTDVDGRIVDWSPGAERLYGWSKESILGRPVSVLHVPEDVERTTADVFDGLSRRGYWHGEIRMLRRDGRIGHIESVVVPLTDAGGRTTGALGINRDITGRAERQREVLRRADEVATRDVERRRVLDEVTRRLRTLTSVASRLPIVPGQESETDGLASELASAVAAARRTLRLADQLAPRPDLPAPRPGVDPRSGTALPRTSEPAEPSTSAAHTPATRQVPPPGHGGRSLLFLVGGDLLLRSAWRHRLEDRHHVLEIPDPDEAIAVTAHWTPDLVLVAEAGAAALVPRLRTSVDWLPVLVVGSESSEISASDAYEAGADAFLGASAAPEEIDARIHSWIRAGRRMRDRHRDRVLFPAPRPKTRADDLYLARVREAITERLEDPTFSVASLARRLAQDRSQLYRRIQDLLETTPSALIWDLRLQRAKELLAAGRAPITEIAHAVGFRSSSHFSKAFRARYGTTPSDWRKSVRGAARG